MTDQKNKIVRLDPDSAIQMEDGKVHISMEDVLDQMSDDYFFECSKKEIQAIIDCIHDGIYITDGTGKTLMLNKAEQEYEESYNDALRVPEDLLGRNVRDFVEGGYWDRSVCMEVLKSGKEESFIVHVNGKSVLTTGIPHYENGKITRIVATDRDVSKLEELQRRNSDAEKQIKKSQVRLEFEAKIRNHDTNRLIYKSEKMKAVINTVKK